MLDQAAEHRACTVYGLIMMTRDLELSMETLCGQRLGQGGVGSNTGPRRHTHDVCCCALEAALQVEVAARCSGSPTPGCLPG